MDEATSNLDDETEELVHKLLESEFRGCTMICISHRQSSLEVADKVVVLKNGKIIKGS
jgi:ABC-type multidrug transport system fused ATPase/permease subunit